MTQCMCVRGRWFCGGSTVAVTLLGNHVCNANIRTYYLQTPIVCVCVYIYMYKSQFLQLGLDGRHI